MTFENRSAADIWSVSTGSADQSGQTAAGVEFPIDLSAIVGLRAHQLKPAWRNAIGLAVPGRDRPLVLQFAKHVEIEVGVEPAVAAETGELFDVAAVVADDLDASALSEQVQDALLGA